VQASMGKGRGNPPQHTYLPFSTTSFLHVVMLSTLQYTTSFLHIVMFKGIEGKHAVQTTQADAHTRQRCSCWPKQHDSSLCFDRCAPVTTVE
jgi:hypothetical protein